MDEVFKSLGDPTRLRIVKMLAENGEVCVCKIVEELGMNQPAISQHVAKLKQAKLLNSRKQGQWIYYSLNTHALCEGPIAFLLGLIESSDNRAKEEDSCNCASAVSI